MLTSDLCWDYYLGIVPNVIRLNQYWWVGQCLVLFYNHFHYRIYFNDFQYEIRFWWSVNGFWYENRITNKSSPSLSCHTSDKSFLLWKWNLWCIIWFSLWKWPFILYDSCYSRGRVSAISFYGWEFEWTSWIWNTRFVMNHPFEKPDFTQANYICRYLDLWLLVNRESDYSSRASGQLGIHRASAHYRRRLTQYRTNDIALTKTQTNIIF